MKNKSGFTRFLGEYSYIFVFVIILIVYMITNNGITWPAAMNIFRHSAAVGIIAVGMGMICLTGDIDLSVGSMLAIVSGFSVVIFNVTNSVLLQPCFRSSTRPAERTAGRTPGDPGVHRDTGYHADLPFAVAVLLPAYRQGTDRRRQLRV